MNPLLLSAVSLILYLSIKDVNIRNLPLNIIMPVILIVLFSPGLILSLPAANNKGIFMSGQSSVATSVVHSVVVGGVFYLLLKNFPEYY